MTLMQINDRNAAHAYLHAELGLHWSDDFRGVLYVPQEFRDTVASPEHVAVAVGYNGFVGRTCCMHTVIRRPDLLTRRVIRESFEFPFLVCGCDVVLGLVDETNCAAMTFDKKLGFSELTRIPGGGLDGDLVILQMRRDECPWLRKPH